MKFTNNLENTRNNGLLYVIMKNTTRGEILRKVNFILEILMNKVELVEAMAKETGLSKKDTEAALKAFLKVCETELSNGNPISLIGFGTFDISNRSERKGRNPLTGAEITIPASKSVKFKPGKALKEKVNK